ncbi:hypothetical protein, partial [Xylophilus sp. ASV27]|uniref:hypothetical protein n=1 Tax=Xylophilus sp. ASV27 TaxID=2795129 RepID=UPI00272CA84E
PPPPPPPPPPAPPPAAPPPPPPPPPRGYSRWRHTRFTVRSRGIGDVYKRQGFDPGANNAVLSLAVQPDGKVLVGGGFTELGGQTVS